MTAVVTGPLTREQQRAALRDLACCWQDMCHGTGWVAVCLFAGSHLLTSRGHSPNVPCDECLPCVWQKYRADFADLAGLRGDPGAEPRGWRDIDDGLAEDPDRDAAALDIAWMRFLSTEDQLIGGSR